jgi:hypothetical protein
MRQPLRQNARVLRLANSLSSNLKQLQRRRQDSDEVKSMKTPTWQTKAGQNPKGGLNAKGRASYNAQTGGNLKAPVKSGDNPRRASFLARMGNMAGAEYKDGEPTRLLLSLKAWGASSKADAKAKARAISERNKAKAK